MKNFRLLIKKHIEAQGIDMHEGYEIELEILADQIKHYWETVELVKEHGLYEVNDKGMTQRNAYAIQMDKCLLNIGRIADKFGVNPYALHRLGKAEKPKKSKFDMI
jgi:phage terminase small subunit